MKLGIMYDTSDMYGLDEQNELFFDFATRESISMIKKSFLKAGYDVHIIGNLDSLITEIQNDDFDCDIVYNTVEGLNSRNREGTVPIILDTFDIPYIGTDSYGLSLTLNKVHTKLIASHLGMLTPKFVEIYKGADGSIENLDKISYLKLPMIIKPTNEGNSSGIVVATEYAQVKDMVLERLKKYDSTVLCEEFIFGDDITVAIIGTGIEARVLGVTKIDKQKDAAFWLDSKEKLYGGAKDIILETDQHTIENIENISLTLYNYLGCRDFGRIDFRLKSNRPYFLEVNPIPLLSYDGTFAVAGAKNGMGFTDVLHAIVESAKKRYSGRF